MKIYESPESEWQVEQKSDHSPLTLADRCSHNVIAAALEDTGIPVLSEEGRHIPYEERRQWKTLWVVDPLDGTKEFIKRNGEFTVNIAIVQEGEPVAGINFNFLGINLGAVPQFNIFSPTWVWNWAHIGAFLIPCLSAGSQVLQMWISQKTNDSVITNEKGVQDAETAKNSQTAQTNQAMMWMMPLMSLWIGFTLSAGLSL